jgi:hypothetical protein
MLAKYAAGASIEIDGFGPHALRATAATNALEHHAAHKLPDPTEQHKFPIGQHYTGWRYTPRPQPSAWQTMRSALSTSTKTT